MNKQPRKDLNLCGYSFTRSSVKCFIQIYRALYGDGAGVKVTETSAIEFCH